MPIIVLGQVICDVYFAEESEVYDLRWQGL